MLKKHVFAALVSTALIHSAVASPLQMIQHHLAKPKTNNNQNMSPFLGTWKGTCGDVGKHEVQISIEEDVINATGGLGIEGETYLHVIETKAASNTAYHYQLTQKAGWGSNENENEIVISNSGSFSDQVSVYPASKHAITPPILFTTITTLKLKGNQLILDEKFKMTGTNKFTMQCQLNKIS